MLTLAVLCSGQGRQDAAMFDLVAAEPDAQAVFAAAAPSLGGRDPRDVVKADGDLHANATAQVLCCVQALAVWAVLKPRVDARLVVAGYSVGEVAAWGVAGALEAATLVAIVAERAALMDAATDGPAGLLAVRGLSGTALDRLCREADVSVAIRNATDRVVLGGRRPALVRAEHLAATLGAVGITPLPVNVASHTPLLREAAARFGEALADREGVHEPVSRLISGIDGAPVFDVREGLAKLARQVAEPVDWAACLQACLSAEATRALELGPGNALARMMGDLLGERESRSVADFRSVDGIARWLQRPAS